MSKKCGIVMEVKNRTACLLTSNGEFVQVKINKNLPSIGSSYTGEETTKFSLNKFVAAAACLILSLSICGGAYAYYTPVASVLVKINPSLELKINRWNKILSATSLNSEGKHILDSIKIKNKSINDGLNIILDQAEKQNFINKEKNSTISLCINSNKDIDLKIAELKSTVKNKNFNLQISAYTDDKNYYKDKGKTNNSNKIDNKNNIKNIPNNDFNPNKSNSSKINKTNNIDLKNNSSNGNLKANDKKTNSPSNTNSINKSNNDKAHQNINKKNIDKGYEYKSQKHNSKKQKSYEKEGNNKKSSN